MPDRGTRVTCLDLSSGDSESTVIADNHVVIVDGSAFVSSLVVYANGTHIYTIKKAASTEEAQRQATNVTRHFGKAALR